MTIQEQIDQWSKLYGRQISEEEYREIMSPILKYHATDTNGKYKDGVIETLDREDAVNKIQTQGLILIKITV